MADNKPTTEQPEKQDATAAGDSQPGQQTLAKFTQEQLDAIVKDRLERATTKTTADLLAQLGIEDIKTAKETLEAAKKSREAQMTELEKAHATIAALEAQSEAVKIEAEAIKARADEALMKSAIIAKAGNFNDPMDAWQFVDRSKIEVSEDGTYKGIDEALKTLTEAKPYLVKVGNGNEPTGPGTPTRPKMKTVAERLLEQQAEQRPKTADELRPNISF